MDLFTFVPLSTDLSNNYALHNQSLFSQNLFHLTVRPYSFNAVITEISINYALLTNLQRLGAIITGGFCKKSRQNCLRFCLGR